MLLLGLSIWITYWRGINTILQDEQNLWLGINAFRGLFIWPNELNKFVANCHIDVLVGFIGTITATANLTSLIRSVKDNEKLKLKVISLDLIVFNLCFSFVTFVLLDLSPLYILKYVQIMICLLVFVGIGSLIFYQDSIFNPPKLGSLGFKIILPERKQEFMLLMSMVLFLVLFFQW